MPKALSAYGIDIFLSMNPACLSFARCFSVNDFYNKQQPRTFNQLLLILAFAGVLLVLEWLGIPNYGKPSPFPDINSIQGLACRVSGVIPYTVSLVLSYIYNC